MKILMYDCNSGISGDMNLGALVDLGVPADYLSTELGKLSISDEFSVSFCSAHKQGIHGTRALVTLTKPDTARHHRHYRDIKMLIDQTPYDSCVKDIANSIFCEVAKAESKVHNEDIESVHFHEVGATDSIVDILGAALAIDYLKVDKIVCSSLNLGGGEVSCEHGVLPVPAPATAEILKGVNCSIGGHEGEFTTPTGAAILKACASEFSYQGAVTIDQIGYGIGEKDFSQPNVLRVVLGKESKNATVENALHDARYGENIEIRANIDDMSPESFEPLLDKLFSIGCQDAFFTPIVMKKSRLAHMLTVLCRAPNVDRILSEIYENSTTIGVRLMPISKHILDRTATEVETHYGTVRVKIVTLPSGRKRWKVEHDDVYELAKKHEIAYLLMRRLVDSEVSNFIDSTAVNDH